MIPSPITSCNTSGSWVKTLGFRNNKITIRSRSSPYDPTASLITSSGTLHTDGSGRVCRDHPAFWRESPALGESASATNLWPWHLAAMLFERRLMHGKTSKIRHDGKTIFHQLPNPFDATRYHSLIVKRATLPSCLEISAETAEGEIMGLRHRSLEIARGGVSFRIDPHHGGRAPGLRTLILSAARPGLPIDDQRRDCQDSPTTLLPHRTRKSQNR